LDDDQAAAIPGTERAVGPFFNPRGDLVGFWADGKLKKVPLGGGLPVEICNVATATDETGLLGASWGTDDFIVFASRQGIARVPAGGGAPTFLMKSSESEQFRFPLVLPGGKAMLYTVLPASFSWEHASIVMQITATGDRRTLVQVGADARYVSSGHLLYMLNGQLMSVPFDAEKLALKGSPVPVLDNVMQAIGAPYGLDDTGAGEFDVSANGGLVYLSGGLFPPRMNDLVWVDRVGTVTPLPLPTGGYVGPRVSPNGELIAFYKHREGSTRQSDVWVYNIGRHTPTRLTVDDDNDFVVWSPDSKGLVFKRVHAGDLERVSADSTGRPEHVMMDEPLLLPASWSSAGNVLALVKLQPRQIWTLAMDGPGKATLFAQAAPFDLSRPEFSRDGRWLAYTSDETGQEAVYVQPYPGPGAKIRVSGDGGQSPVWAHNGRELFFLERSAGMTKLMVTDIDTSKEFRFSNLRPLFEWKYGAATPTRGYDIALDDQHFITTRTAGSPEPPFTQMHVILNWIEELR
jgi:hypothetical protein